MLSKRMWVVFYEIFTLAHISCLPTQVYRSLNGLPFSLFERKSQLSRALQSYIFLTFAENAQIRKQIFLKMGIA